MTSEAKASRLLRARARSRLRISTKSLFPSICCFAFEADSRPSRPRLGDRMVSKCLIFSRTASDRPGPSEGQETWRYAAESQCPLSGVKRTFSRTIATSVFGPKRTLGDRPGQLPAPRSNRLRLANVRRARPRV
jgi:hypothetical protein